MNRIDKSPTQPFNTFYHLCMICIKFAVVKFEGDCRTLLVFAEVLYSSESDKHCRSLPVFAEDFRRLREVAAI